MAIILNERKYAEEILEKGEVGDKPASTLFLLAKYYVQVQKLKASEISIKLDEFMQENFKNYNSVQWEDLIEDYSKKVTKKDSKLTLKEIDKVSISSTEIEKIKMAVDLKYQKLLFTMLCYAKYKNACSAQNNSWVNTDIRELFSVARVTVHYRKDKFLMLNDLERAGLIEFSKKNDNLNMRITFIDNSDAALEINDFRELGYEWEDYIGNGNFIRCKDCNIVIKKTNNKICMCKNCAYLEKLRQNNSYYHSQK